MSDGVESECPKCGQTGVFHYEWMGTYGGGGTMLRSCPTCGYTYTEPPKDATATDPGPDLDRAQLALVRRLASDYHNHLMGGADAMDAIVAAIL